MGEALEVSYNRAQKRLAALERVRETAQRFLEFADLEFGGLRIETDLREALWAMDDLDAQQER